MRASSLEWNAVPQVAVLKFWPILLGLLALAIPTIITTAQQHWSTEAGAHGPLVIATGAWLIWRELQTFEHRGTAGNFAMTLAILIPALLLYTFGRAFDFLTLEVGGLFVAGAAIFYSLFGAETLRRLWFPLLYLAFVIPLPEWLLDYATAPLKEVASVLTTNLLQLFGFPIVREGVTLYVAQYQLLVEDACAGMNAFMGLMSLGLFYTYIAHGSSWRYCLVLAAFILPVAVLANVVRIIILVMLTFYAGDDVAQGYLHEGAGLVMFASALLLIFAIDSVLSRLFRSWSKPA